ncbi:protein WFDC9 isoform X1 [Ochotona princeps]|uniref:protein WFDC9 isoform X1 n=1 Tax=Ochotona princeps TaxID=9978 RepID=UPI0027150741|nr:protein WFDC9 isoform X1 [Ochotona princeps]XP_058535792.1 protein WFDC9 isoform X1 [Ochotona princeps]XP_058535793.1 protein WFDC9 isoform X1 [Ochotona princeps]
MKPWILPFIVLIHEFIVLLPVLGGHKYKHHMEFEINQCWVQPPEQYCRKRCTRGNSCLQDNHTCCWTYCGNICLNNNEPFKTMLKPLKP